MSSKREILEAHWRAFRISTGLPYQPMSERAYEFMEKAMEEYSDENKKSTKQLIPVENGSLDTVLSDNAKKVAKEIYLKFHELNEFYFVEWLSKQF